MAHGYGGLAHAARALGALCMLAGCADDGVSLHVICPIAPEVEDEGCVYDPGSDMCVLEGVMNLASTNYYRQTLRVESGLKPRMREVPPVAEPNGIQLTAAEVEIRSIDGRRFEFDYTDDMGSTRTLPNPFEVVASGYVQPEGTGAITLPLITADYARLLIAAGTTATPRAPQIVVAVKVKGKTNGDQVVKSGEFLWPLRLISIDPNPATNMGCVPMEYCLSSLGSDGFAAACR